MGAQPYDLIQPLLPPETSPANLLRFKSSTYELGGGHIQSIPGN